LSFEGLISRERGPAGRRTFRPASPEKFEKSDPESPELIQDGSLRGKI